MIGTASDAARLAHGGGEAATEAAPVRTQHAARPRTRAGRGAGSGARRAPGGLGLGRGVQRRDRPAPARATPRFGRHLRRRHERTDRDPDAGRLRAVGPAAGHGAGHPDRGGPRRGADLGLVEDGSLAGRLARGRVDADPGRRPRSRRDGPFRTHRDTGVDPRHVQASRRTGPPARRIPWTVETEQLQARFGSGRDGDARRVRRRPLRERGGRDRRQVFLYDAPPGRRASAASAHATFGSAGRTEARSGRTISS